MTHFSIELPQIGLFGPVSWMFLSLSTIDSHS
jgi:hypothetical protein